MTWNWIKTKRKVYTTKCRTVPLLLQEAVEEEIRNILENHIERVSEVNEEYIQPVVVTVKRAKRVKIALDTKAFIIQLFKDKYQMPNLEHLVDLVAERQDKKGYGPTFCTHFSRNALRIRTSTFR